MSSFQSTITDQIKCAEIYRHNDGSGQSYLSFVCFHCGESFNSFDDISGHIGDQHCWDAKITIKQDPFEENIVEDYQNIVVKEENAQINLVSSIEFIELKKELTDDLQQKLLPQDQNAFDIIPTNILIKETYFETEQDKKPAQKKKISKKRYNCSCCNRTFRDNKALEAHLAGIANLQQFKCDICKDSSRGYNTKTSLEQHMVRMHNGPVVGRPFVCSTCNATFRLKGSLKNHISTKHFEKRYKCEYCDKPFAVPSALKIHIRTHTKERPVQCHICGKGFRSTGSHNNHLKRRHNIENKSLTCTICNRDFASLISLERHTLELHGTKEYHCKVCGNTFKNARALRQHMDLHGEKRHKCNYCDMKFAQSAGRRGHEKAKHLNI